MKIKFKIAFLLLWFCAFSFGQMKEYNYKRALSGIKDEWHNIILPNELFGKVKQDLSDIRVFGITENNDTIEVPFILKLAAEKTTEKEMSFHLINQSKNGKGYYYTLEMGKQNSVNEIRLDFKQENFDWKIDIEGSQNQNEWFSIVDNYRILSIKNSLTDFKFTRVNFPNARYRYFRLHIESNKPPELLSTKVILTKNESGKYLNYSISSTKVVDDKKNKQTVLDIKLPADVPVSYLKIGVKNNYDYYRPLTIEYLSDSTKAPADWIYHYNTLTVGTLNSLENNEFKFNSTTLKRIKVVIENQDNAALEIESVTVKGFEHQLIARFDAKAIYYLTYGNTNVTKPAYDIDRFTDNIPTTCIPLKVGVEQLIDKKAVQKEELLFKNKAWLWAIITSIILLLGWFSIKMIRQK